MGLKKPNNKIVDLRKAPKDIIRSVKSSDGLGEKIDSLGRVGKKLTSFLRGGFN